MPPRARGEQRAGLPVGTAVAAALAVAALVVGMRPLGDNSFLTHLATGRLILDTGSVPTVDPYTFTAGGEPWVVQSWLASVAYAGLEELAGPGAIRLLVGLAFASVVLVAWMLSRAAASLLARTAIVGTVLLVGGSLWSERPLVFGLVFLAATLVVVERTGPWWALVPVGWLWVNTHGSFPLGIVLVALIVAGTALDRRPVLHELRCLLGLVAGCLLGVAGPLGSRALTFPVELLSRQELLQEVVEWRAPTFDTLSQRMFLVQLLLAGWFLVRRPSWRHGLVMAVFGALALLSVRNVVIASLVLVPGMAAGAPPVGSLRAADRHRGVPVVLAAVVLLAPLAALARLGQDDYDLRRRYPVAAIEWLGARQASPLDVRTAAPDIVGNVHELLYGAHGAVFYDDRFDMFPAEVSEDHLALVRGRPGWQEALDRWDIEVALAPTPGPYAQLLLADPAWRPVFLDDEWVVACRRWSGC